MNNDSLPNSGELFDVTQRKKNQALDSPNKVYRYSESKAARIVPQMLSVLVELHCRGIVHRYVKPENILPTNDSQVCAKLSDFGTSRELHPEEDSDSCSSDGEASPLTPQSRKRAYSAVGSNFCAAPEVRSGDGYDTAVDLYSLGVTLYVLLCGFPPSFSTNDKDDVNVVIFLSTCNLLDDVKCLIRNMLDRHCLPLFASPKREPFFLHQSHDQSCTLSVVREHDRLLLSCMNCIKQNRDTEWYPCALEWG
jgi:serine/threonine protein kinase